MSLLDEEKLFAQVMSYVICHLHSTDTETAAAAAAAATDDDDDDDDGGYCFLCSLCLTNRALMLLVWCQEGHPVCKTYHCSKKKTTYFLRETCRGPSHIHVGMENRSVKEKLSSSRTDSKTLHREREG